MEYRIARLFVAQGYFVRRGRDILTTAGLDRATDLDVLALRYRELLSKESIIVESKTGGEGPLDRVFWLSGVKTFVQADRALLFRKPTRWNIKDFAKQTGVEIIDLNWVERLESQYVHNTRVWPGICDPEFLQPRIRVWNEILRKSPKLQELLLTLSTETRFDSPFAGVNFWVHHLRGLTRQLGSEHADIRDFTAFLIADAVGQLSVFLMRITQFGGDLRPEDRRGMVEKGLTYGELDPALAKKVFDHAYRLSKATLREYLTRDVNLDEKLFRIPRPDHVDVITAVIEELASHPIQATSFPQITDLTIAEGLLKRNRNQGLLRQVFPADGLSARVALVRNYLSALVSIGALPDDANHILDARSAEVAEVDTVVGGNHSNARPATTENERGPENDSQPKLFTVDEKPKVDQPSQMDRNEAEHPSLDKNGSADDAGERSKETSRIDKESLPSK